MIPNHHRLPLTNAHFYIHPTAAMVLDLGTEKARLRIQGLHGKPKS